LKLSSEIQNSRVKVLLIGSHLGYNLEHYMKLALERMGIDVSFVGFQASLGRFAWPIRVAISRSKRVRWITEPFGLSAFNNLVEKTARALQPELVLVIKGEAVLPSTLKQISTAAHSKIAIFNPDDPRYFDSLVKDKASLYDHFFTGSEGALPLYKEAGIDNVTFVPFACDPSVHRTIRLSDEQNRIFGSPTCFVGAYYPSRGKLLGQLGKFNLAVWGPYWRISRVKATIHKPVRGPDLAKVFSASKIIINAHHPDHLNFMTNMRVFETTGCGAFLLTDRSRGLERHFEIGKEVVCYDSVAEFVELVEYFLMHDEERMQVAKRGQLRAYRDHTYDNRVRQILRSLELEPTSRQSTASAQEFIV
jgi:spore maturation protein CgeB